MYGYTMDKDGKFELFDYPASMGQRPFCMHQGATPDGKFIVGYYRENYTPTTGGGPNRGYILTTEDNVVTTFALPGANVTTVQDVNQAGLIVGMYRSPGEPTSVYHGFAIDTKLSTDQSKWTCTYLIDFPGSSKTMIRGVNARGDVVGDYLGADGKTHGFVARRGPR